MYKRSFFGLSKPWLTYGKITGKPQAPVNVSIPSHVSLYLETTGMSADRSRIEVGSRVRTGEKLPKDAASFPYVISSVTGTVESATPFTGDFGRTFLEVRVKTEPKDEFDDAFSARCQTPNKDTLGEFMAYAPGNPVPGALFDADRPIHTIVVTGLDQDLMLTSMQHALMSDIASLKKGIELLREISGIERMVLLVPQDVFQGFGHIGAEIKGIENRYPAGLPRNAMRLALGQIVPEGKIPEDLGVTFISAEGAISLGRAFNECRIPVEKTFTVIDKNLKGTMTTARIGTPIRSVFETLGIAAEDGDRIVFGGPMRGSAVYSLDQAIAPDTEGIMIQDKDTLPYVSSYPCVNCGECVRICPTRVPVNMLVRFLEAGQYQDAADLYDLYCCIDCGLCSFVCVSKIPIFQYIRLAKYELARAQTAEASDEQL